MRRADRDQQRVAQVHHREALETFRSLINLERGSWSVFAATDVLLVAYGLYIKVAGPILFGILVLVALLISSISVHRHLVAVGFVIFANEKLLGGGVPLGTTYALTRTPELVEAYENVLLEETDTDRAAVLRTVDSGAIGARSIITIGILTAAQVILVATVLLAGYKMF